MTVSVSCSTGWPINCCVAKDGLEQPVAPLLPPEYTEAIQAFTRPLGLYGTRAQTGEGLCKLSKHSAK